MGCALLIGRCAQKNYCAQVETSAVNPRPTSSPGSGERPVRAPATLGLTLRPAESARLGALTARPRAGFFMEWP